MGRDKALAELDGKKLLDRQIKKGEPFFEEVVLLRGVNRYRVENRQLADRFENAGPLSGLLEALMDGAAKSLKYIAIIPVDLPGISELTIRKLAVAEPLKTEDAILLSSGEDLQPLAGVYSVDLADDLAHFLEAGNRMVFAFANGLNYAKIEVDRAELKNINHPEDLE